jgi:hypothetical protein
MIASEDIHSKPLLARDAGGDGVAVAPHQSKFLKDFRNYFDAQ